MKEPKEPKRQGAIKAPQIPRALPPAELLRDLPEEHESYSQLDYQGLDLAGRGIERLHFETVSFGQLAAAESRLDHLRLEDVRFTGCNLATAAWPNMACVRAAHPQKEIESDSDQGADDSGKDGYRQL